MIVLLWVLLGIVIVAAAILLIAYLCFRTAFYAKKTEPSEEFRLPPGRIYEPYRDTMFAWMKELRALPHEVMTITSFDGLTLYGNYYEYSPGSPIELMFHGYRGLAERDLCGGVQRSFALGRSVLLVDQRASGRSDGHVISFGINESRDCATWVEHLIRRFGPERKILLTGISMGAATVLIAAGRPLPPSVVGVLADCGYSTARDIIEKTIRERKLPPKLAYPFVKLGARLYGHFDLEETSPLAAMAHCRLPVLFFHGEDDRFVPCEMSRQTHAACTAEKQLVTVPGAGHGLCYLMDPDGYLAALRAFAPHWGLAETETAENAGDE